MKSDEDQIDADIKFLHEALKAHAWLAGVASSSDDGGAHVVVFVDKELVSGADPLEFPNVKSRSCYVTGKSSSAPKTKSP